MSRRKRKEKNDPKKALRIKAEDNAKRASESGARLGARRRFRLSTVVKAGAPVNIDTFTDFIGRARGTLADPKDKEIKRLFKIAKPLLGKTFTTKDIAELAKSSRAGVFGNLAAAPARAGRGLGALGKALSAGGGIGKLGKMAGGLGALSIGGNILASLIGGLMDDRRETSQINRFADDPAFLEKTILADLDDQKLNALRQERNLRRIKKLGMLNPKLIDQLQARAIGNPTVRLAPGEIRIGRQAILDQEKALKQLANRNDIFQDG